MQLVKLSQVKGNPKNPRVLVDYKYKKLLKSIQDFPDMLNKRPLIVFTDKDDKYVVLGGNMRLKALKELKYKEVPVIVADEWTEEQKAEFLIKDNLNYGDWDWDSLANEWNEESLEDWGLNVPTFADEVDYSILDDEDLSEQLEGMTNGVKKAIQIEFEAEDYESAYDLVKFWREQGLYIGGFLMEKLKEEKEKQ